MRRSNPSGFIYNQPDGYIYSNKTLGIQPIVLGIPGGFTTENRVPTEVGIIPRVTNAFGRGLAFDSADADTTVKRIIFADAPWNRLTGAFTIVSVFNLRTPPSRANKGLVAKYIATTALRSFQQFIDYQSHATEVYVNTAVSSNGTAFVSAGTGIPISNGYHVAISVYVPSTSLTTYLDGALYAQNTVSIPASLFNTTADLMVGTSSTLASSTSCLAGDINLYGLFSGAATPTVALALSKNPWQIFKPKSKYVWFSSQQPASATGLGLNLKSTYNTQPQGIADINWANPVTKNLVIATLPNGSDLINVVNHEVATINGTKPTITTGQYGKGFNFNNGNFRFVNAGLGANTTSHTQIHLINYPPSAGKNYATISNISSSDIFVLQQDSVAGSLIIWIAPAINLNYDLRANRGTHCLAVTRQGGTTTQTLFYVDGILKTTASVGTVWAANPPFLIGDDNYTGADDSFDGTIFLSLVFNRVLTAIEINSLSANPWQIFKKNTFTLQVAFGSAESSSNITVADIMSGTDILSNILASLGIADTASSTDILASLNASLALNDVGNGIETLTNLSIALLLTDSGIGLDSPIGVSNAITVSDTGISSDTLTSLLASLGLIDTGISSDNITNLSVSLGLSDTGVGSDVTPIGASVPVVDTSAGIDTLNIITDILIALADSGTFTDSVSQLLVSLTLAENGFSSENIAQILNSLVIAETGAGSEGLFAGNLLSIAEVGAALDTISSLFANLPINEVGTGTDAITNLLASLLVTDSGIGIDVITVITASLIAIAESGLGVDALGGITVTANIADAGTGTENTVVLASLTVADLFTGSEAIPISVGLAVSDSGIGSDGIALLIATLIQVLEASSGVDNLSNLTVSLSLVDTAIGASNISNLNVFLNLLEAAGASETVVKYDAAVQVLTVRFTLAQRASVFVLPVRPTIFIPIPRGTLK